MECPICQHPAQHFWDKDSYQIFFCSSCCHKFVFPHPLASTLRDFYQNYEEFQKNFNARTEKNSCDVSPRVRRDVLREVRTQSEIDLIAAFFPSKGYFLDVGSGDGLAVFYAKNKGFQSRGIEISKVSVHESSTRYDINVTPVDFIEYDPGDLKFDVIRMKSYIEHMAQPQAHLKKAYDLLTEKGILVITTENYDSFDARRWGARWKYVMPPVHLSFFSPQSLGRLLTSSGFAKVIIDDRGWPRYTLFFKNRFWRYNPLFFYLGVFFHLNPCMTAYAVKDKNILQHTTSLQLNRKMAHSLQMNLLKYFGSFLISFHE